MTFVRSTAFFINGGAGRVICSIPALEKYAEENPDDDFIIVCEGGTDFYKGHPLFGKKAYDIWHKNLFEEKIKIRNCVSPEPYRVWEYYNQKCNLAQAFDISINNKGIRELPRPSIYINKHEMIAGASVVEEVKTISGFDKVLVVQPFGRSTENINDFIVDATSRSFQLDNILDIVQELRKEYGIIIMSEIPLNIETKNNEPPIAHPKIPDLKVWSGIINAADHFLGCDSLGQHIVKALDKSATVVTGSTYPINISYPTDPKFDIIDVGNGKRVYSPIRLATEEEQNRHNDEVMELTKEQIKDICNSVRKRLGISKNSKSKITNTSLDTQPKLIPGSKPLK